jgi:hypothetical protein
MAAAALVDIKSAAATRVMRRKVFFMVQRNSDVYSIEQRTGVLARARR